MNAEAQAFVPQSAENLALRPSPQNGIFNAVPPPTSLTVTRAGNSVNTPSNSSSRLGMGISQYFENTNKPAAFTTSMLADVGGAFAGGLALATGSVISSAIQAGAQNRETALKREIFETNQRAAEKLGYATPLQFAFGSPSLSNQFGIRAAPYTF